MRTRTRATACGDAFFVAFARASDAPAASRDEYERRVIGAGGDELEQARAKGRSLAFEAAMEEALRRPAGAGAP